MPKFTPGRWETGSYTNRNQRVNVVDGGARRIGLQIAQVYDQNAYMGGAHHLFPAHDEAVANAALIADGPEMYELLRELINGNPDISLLKCQAEMLIAKHA